MLVSGLVAPLASKRANCRRKATRTLTVELKFTELYWYITSTTEITEMWCVVHTRYFRVTFLARRRYYCSPSPTALDSVAAMLRFPRTASSFAFAVCIMQPSLLSAHKSAVSTASTFPSRYISCSCSTKYLPIGRPPLPKQLAMQTV